MLTALLEQYDQLEAARHSLVWKLRRLGAERLSFKPGPERWSILEEIQHLVLAEQKTALKKGTATASGGKDAEMLAMVLHVLDQDMVVDVPDPDMVPDGDADFEGLVRQWGEVRSRLKDFLEACGPDDLEASVSHHAVAGPLTVGACLRLISAHFNHHRRRIEAIIDDL